MTFKIGERVSHRKLEFGVGTVVKTTGNRTFVSWDNDSISGRRAYSTTNLIQSMTLMDFIVEMSTPVPPTPHKTDSIKYNHRQDCANTRCPTPGLCTARCYSPRDLT